MSRSNATPRVTATKTRLHLENARMRVVIDLTTGSYSGVDKATRTAIFKNARFRLDAAGNRSWPEPKMTVTWRKKIVKDAFGHGLRVTLVYTTKGRYTPNRLLLLTLYRDQSFLSIGWGVRNRFDYPIRVCDVEPLFAGQLFAGQEISEPQSLRGGAGAEPNVVEKGWQIEAMNSAMLTYRDGRQRRTVVAGGLTYAEFGRRVELLDGIKVWGNGPEPSRKTGFPQLSLACWDPHGKFIPPRSTHVSPDTLYLDFTVSDPFEALERYGMAMQTANNAQPNLYDFPTLCGWMVSNTSLGEGKLINNSPGLIEELDIANTHGFMKYSPLAVRLEPDHYCYDHQGDTQQGWWDDEHWSQYGSLRKPYANFATFCKAVTARGGVPFTYFQCSMPSNDFAGAHPAWMLNRDVSRLHVEHAHHRPLVRYDYTHPGFRKHVLRMWKRLRRDGMQGIKFDYPETAWARQGGFADTTFTTTSAYRELYRLCREGLGPHAYIHERILGNSVHEDVPRLDTTAGLVDLQRVWGDASHFEPEMASRIGLRWYKNRRVFQYYPDGKSFFREGRPLPSRQRRTFLTLIGFLSGRLELGTSIGSMTPEMIHDVTRLYPMFTGAQSPRPVDMLLGKRHPSVYAYRVTPQWTQVVLVNNGKRTATVSTPLSGDQPTTGSLGLNPRKRYYVFDFWEQRCVGRFKGHDALSLSLRAEEARMFSVREALTRPQVLSTNRHIMQGLMELHACRWSPKARRLSGQADVIGGEPFVLTLATNGYTLDRLSVSHGEGSHQHRQDLRGGADIILSCPQNTTVSFSITFRRRP